MALFDYKTFSPQQASQLTNIPGKSLAETNTREQLLAAGSLQGTLTTPRPTTPTSPTLPTGTTQTSPFALAQVMDVLRSKVQSNNALMTQRNLLLKQLYNEPLNDQEKAQLDPTLLNAINSGDRNQIDMRLRLIGDEVSGRTKTLDQSVEFLTKSYTDTITQAEKSRQDAINNITKFAEIYGSNAKSALTSLYGPDYVEQLKGMGVDLDKFTGLKTLEQLKEEKAGGLGGGGLLNPDYAGVIQTILGSGKFTKDQTAQITRAINSGEDPFAVVKNQAKALMTGANQTKIESYETAQNALNNLETTLKEFYGAGGSTGIFKGNYEKVINKLGEVDNPKLVEIATQIQQNLQIYRNAVSGTAYSVQEGADIASIFPGITKSEGLNKAIINGRRRAFNDGIDGAYKGVLGSAYEKLKNLEKKPTETTSGTTVMTAPDGKKWNVPSDKVELFKQNGYK